MADKNLKARIVNKNGTSAEWEKATSFVPKKGELILYTDLNKIKIGDGVTKVNDLPFLTVPNKTSDLTNDSDYITNTSVDTKLEGKVSKAGDTMTGCLAVSLNSTPYIGAIALGQNAPVDLQNIKAPCILGNAEHAGRQDSLILQSSNVLMGRREDDRLVKVFSTDETGAKVYMGLKFYDADNTYKGSLSDTADGVALSADNGTCLKVGAEAVTVCDNAGGTTQIKGVKAPVNDTDAANKKYVDDAIPTAQIEELSSAVAKAEPFFVEFTNTGTIDDPQWSANKTFSEIKSAHDTGRLCYAQVEQKNVIVPLIGFTEYNAKKKAIFSTSVLFSSHLNTQALTITEDNLISIERFVSQSQITTTGLLKGDGDNITAAVAGTDYAAANHTHDTYTATEIDTMWNAVTIN